MPAKLLAGGVTVKSEPLIQATNLPPGAKGRNSRTYTFPQLSREIDVIEDDSIVVARLEVNARPVPRVDRGLFEASRLRAFHHGLALVRREDRVNRQESIGELGAHSCRLTVKLRGRPGAHSEGQRFKNADSEATFAELPSTSNLSYSRRTPNILTCACTPTPQAKS